jgi:general secretion pathway protein G
MNMKLRTLRTTLAARGGKRHAQAGMTLIEIMVVLTLLGLLMTVLAVNFFGMAESQKVKITQTQMKTIQGRLDAFKQEYGKYPTSSQGLNALVSPPPKKGGRTPGAFLDDDNLLTDPWGNPLEYSVPGPNGKPYKITSFGADSAPGGEGTKEDIDNWQKM